MSRTMSILRCLLISVLSAFLPVLTGCSSDNDNGGSDIEIEESLKLDIPKLYSTVRFINVVVVYEPGAEPFTGTTAGGIQYWSMFEKNIQALFEARSIEPQVSVPKSLSAMEKIASQKQISWTVEEIVELAEKVYGYPGDPSTAEISVIFLKGYFNEDGTDNPKVIGISVTGTPVIVVFKDVVRATSATTLVARYVEQATLVHEFGHLAGLVESGVPAVTAHLDPDHPKHCTDDECVMYWQNEGSEDLSLFVQQIINTGSLVMFGPECLEDARSYLPE